MERRITGHTELIGLVATPIKHSMSPVMQNAAFQKLGLDYAYLAFEIEPEQLTKTIEGFKAMNVRGWNVSMPYKVVMADYMDHITPVAKLCGAINTVINDNGVLTGTITDGPGYMMSLKDAGVDPIGKKMTIIGAGGAATAIVIQAALDGVKEISIFNIKDASWERAQENVDKINSNTDCVAKLFDLADEAALKTEIDSSYILVNATGVGMKPMQDKMPIPSADFLRSDLVVSDVIYIPEKTKLLLEAEKLGCKTVNGIGMMLYQGALSFKAWTNQDMPIDYVKEVLNIK